MELAQPCPPRDGLQEGVRHDSNDHAGSGLDRGITGRDRARQARCGVCWAGPGEPCGDTRGDLAGLHLGRYAAARRGGLITAATVAAAIEAAGAMFTPATLIPVSSPEGHTAGPGHDRDGTPDDGESCPRCGAVNWGMTPDGRDECVSCGYVGGAR